MENRRSYSLLKHGTALLAVALMCVATGLRAEECTYTPMEAYQVAKQHGFEFRCVAYYEEKNIVQSTHFTTFPEDGTIGCSGKTPNELGIAWIYMNLFSRDSGLGGNWSLWHYEVSGLPHTRIGDGAPIRLITTMLGPNATYAIKVTKMVLINPYKKCTGALAEAFG